MTRMHEQADGVPVDHAPVQVQVPASPRSLFVLRAVSEAVALQTDLDLDEVADVRLAVDEAATNLIARAAPAAMLTCLVHAEHLGVRVRLTTVAAEQAQTGLSGFRRQVLRALTDSIVTEQDSHDIVTEQDSHDTDHPADTIVIDFVRQHGGAHGSAGVGT